VEEDKLVGASFVIREVLRKVLREGERERELERTGTLLQSSFCKSSV
jgi:hypothetical protein